MNGRWIFQGSRNRDLMEASTLERRAGKKGETFRCRSGKRLPSPPSRYRIMAWEWGISVPDVSTCGRGSKSWWRLRCGWQWGHLIVMSLVTFTGWLCSPSSRALTSSFNAFNHIAGSLSEIQTPRPSPLIQDSEGLGSRLVNQHVIDALWNYLWTLNDIWVKGHYP